ncbi:MAG: hypothetical protein ACI93G_000551 [Hyphomonas sp.]|jgi:hypothetical protein
MNREAITQIFRSVPVMLWPFVWLQLVVLFRRMNRQQREVLVRIDHRSGPYPGGLRGRCPGDG